MKERENIKELKMEERESLHTCGHPHSSLCTSPNTYSGPSREWIEKEIGNLFLSVLERLEREGGGRIEWEVKDERTHSELQRRKRAGNQTEG